MKQKTLFLSAMAMSLALAGCSGSGNNTVQNRQIQLGDQWVLAGNIVNGDVTRPVSVTIDVVTKDLDGSTYLTFLRGRTVDGVFKNTRGDLVTQGADNHDLTIVGKVRDEDPPFAVTHQMFLPGNLIIGFTWTDLGDEANAEDDQTNEVVAQETLTTPAGTFDTYKIHAVQVDGQTSDRWLAPSLGYFVKTVVVRPAAEGVEVETKELQSTNVAP